MPDYGDDFACSANADQLWDKLHQALAQFSITNVFYGIGHLPEKLETTHLPKLLSSSRASPSFHYKTSYPPELINTNDDDFHFEDDLSGLHCLTKTTPFIWYINSRHLSNQDYELRKASQSYWFAVKLVGVSIPLRFADFGKGGIGLCAANLSGDQFDEIWAQNSDEIIDICYKFDETVRDKFIDLVGITLTKREKDILAWLAEGYSAKIIADNSGTKKRTVENQIVSLREKLDARNNVHLITKAMTFKLI